MRASATGAQAEAAVATAGLAQAGAEVGQAGAAGAGAAGVSTAGGEPAPPGPAGRYTVRSVARALQLVDIVAEGPAEGQTLSDLARALGASKSTTLSLARTMAAAGLLRDARPGPRYTLGTALIRLGDIARRQLPLGSDLHRSPREENVHVVIKVSAHCLPPLHSIRRARRPQNGASLPPR